MLVHRRRRSRFYVQAPLTSLIDTVFLLLIYFLLTTNFMVEEGIKIKLPQAKASAPQTEEVITVYVDQEGRAFLGTQEVFQAPEGHFQGSDHLGAHYCVRVDLKKSPVEQKNRTGCDRYFGVSPIKE